MPKRNRQRSRTSSQNSSASKQSNELGHTPKWTRSSPSDSEELDDDSDVPQVKEEEADTQEMQCILPGHPPLVLKSPLEYELHYTRDHNNQCIACRANLPSPWLLELHHEENHDPLIAAKRDDGEKTYRCFLPDCEKVTLTAQKRRLHLIDKHQFPKNYDFRLVDSGLKGKSLLRPAKVPSGKSKLEKGTKVLTPAPGPSEKASSQQIPAKLSKPSATQSLGENLKPDVSKPKPTSSATQKQKYTSSSKEEETLDSLSNAMSSLTFVPMSVRMKNKKSNS